MRANRIYSPSAASGLVRTCKPLPTPSELSPPNTLQTEFTSWRTFLGSSSSFQAEAPPHEARQALLRAVCPLQGHRITVTYTQ
ncbi:uncharacterized protein CLUP02_07769 [Colletotrichum lupini]|uniref:Uncharacterized protein n=1 Tax=Colletotrichum lupini TaxID=145971 RepID=A0A9Q8WGU0_9PEZI|nr:uncharacterized protein CLUP02_07769 [Colletotrichum lupini]UQC82282.1 hypothetical protein CLUP02_07769 [Colletotrichum lupini]